MSVSRRRIVLRHEDKEFFREVSQGELVDRLAWGDSALAHEAAHFLPKPPIARSPVRFCTMPMKAVDAFPIELIALVFARVAY